MRHTGKEKQQAEAKRELCKVRENDKELRFIAGVTESKTNQIPGKEAKCESPANTQRKRGYTSSPSKVTIENSINIIYQRRSKGKSTNEPRNIFYPESIS